MIFDLTFNLRYTLTNLGWRRFQKLPLLAK